MSVKVRKFGIALAVVASAALVAMGCGGDGGGGGDGGDARLADEQELVVQVGEETEGTWDPATPTYLDTVNRVNAMFATLYRYDEDGDDIVPYLAEDLPEVSEDGLTYTVKLRDDLKWSDGEPITAAHVRDGVLHALNPETGAAFAFYILDIKGACEYNAGKDAKKACAGDWELTDGKPESVAVRAVDDQTVEFTLRRQVPWFRYLLTLHQVAPIRADVIEKFGKDWTKPENIVVSGPFILDEYKRGDRAVLVKNDQFFNADEVELDRIVFRFIGEIPSALREFRRGKIDTGFGRTLIPAEDIDELKATDEYYTQPSSETQYLWLNTTNPALSDPKVRQGIALTIDRKTIVDDITKRGDKPLTTVVPRTVAGYDVIKEATQDFMSDDGSPELDKARGLIEEGGWKETDTLDIYFATDSGTAKPIAEQIQSDLEKVGVKVEIHGLPGSTFSTVGFGKSPTSSKVDGLLQGWIQDYPDAQDWYQLFICEAVEGELNSSNYCSEEFDKVYEEAVATVDDDARIELYQELEGMLTGPDGDMPAVPLYQPNNDTLVQTWVEGFGYNSTGLIYYDDIAITEDKPDAS